MSNPYREDIDRFIEHDIHPGSRTIYMGEQSNSDGDGLGTDHMMVERVVKGLHLLEAKNTEPITILMNNPGGDEFHGMGIYDAIKACKSHVTIKVFGHAMSMGSIILQAADRRVVFPNSTVMIHYGTFPADNKQHTKDAYRWVNFSKRFDRWMEDLYLEKIQEKHSKFTRAQLQHRMNFDYFLIGQDAVDFGLADEAI